MNLYEFIKELNIAIEQDGHNIYCNSETAKMIKQLLSKEHIDLINKVDNFMNNKWIPETDACDICQECDYFLHDYWNCQGEPEPCLEFLPKIGSKYRKVNLTVTNEVNDENNR